MASRWYHERLGCLALRQADFDRGTDAQRVVGQYESQLELARTLLADGHHCAHVGLHLPVRYLDRQLHVRPDQSDQGQRRLHARLHMNRIDQVRDRRTGRDILAALREPLRHDARERRAQLRLIEIVLRDALAHLRLLQLSREHAELRANLIELRLRDRAAHLLQALQLALRHRTLRLDARNFRLRIVDTQPHGVIFELRDTLAFANSRADFRHVFEPAFGARREPRIVAADDATRHPAPRGDARHRSLGDFHGYTGLLLRRRFGRGSECGKGNRGGERQRRNA
jgi:hypothetical protein